MVREADGGLHINAYPHLHTLSSQAPSTPWCMRLADTDGTFKQLCFDFDAKTDDDAAVEDSESLAAHLTTLGIPHVLCESSSSGGRHLWIAPAGGYSSAQTAALAIAARAHYRTLDHGMLLNPREGAARPPLSPHRNGSHSRILHGTPHALLEPAADPQQLDALTELLRATAPASHPADSSPSGPTSNHNPHRTLSRWGKAHMATTRGGTNPSWTAFMCLLAAASAGWSLRDVEHAARTAPGMEHYRTKNTGRGTRRPRATSEATERLHRQWLKALGIAQLHSTSPQTREPRDLSDLSELIDRTQTLLNTLHTSPGRWTRTEAAANQRSVLIALAHLMVQTGKTTVAASIRDLALLAGIGRTTAATALRTLVDNGWITKVHPTDAPNAAEFELSHRFSTPSDNVRSQPLKNPRPPTELFTARSVIAQQLTDLLTDQRHDLFTRAGFGHRTGMVYAHLRSIDESVTKDTLASTLGLDLRTASRALGLLRSARLVVKRAAGWARSRQDRRDTVARQLGIRGTLQARAESYRRERELWAWWLAEYATMTSQPRQRPRRQHVTSRQLFNADEGGERNWPRYPRDTAGRADHRTARSYVDAGVLSPTSRWKLGDVAA